LVFFFFFLDFGGVDKQMKNFLSLFLVKLFDLSHSPFVLLAPPLGSLTFFFLQMLLSEPFSLNKVPPFPDGVGFIRWLVFSAV